VSGKDSVRLCAPRQLPALLGLEDAERVFVLVDGARRRLDVLLRLAEGAALQLFHGLEAIAGGNGSVVDDREPRSDELRIVEAVGEAPARSRRGTTCSPPGTARLSPKARSSATRDPRQQPCLVELVH
jgi:hypothetical protein